MIVRSLKNDGFAGKTPDRTPTAEDSGPTNQQVPLDIPRVYKELGKRSASSASSAGDEKATVVEAQTNSTNSETHNPAKSHEVSKESRGTNETPHAGTPSEEQRRRIDRLVRQGMAEHLARAEVIG